MRTIFARLGWLGLLALLAASCQRNLVYLNTPEPALTGDTTQPPERSASVRELQGRVETRTSENAEWAAARDGQIMTEGGQVRTGEGASVVVELTEGTRIYLDGNSEIAINELNPFLDSQLTALDLKQGQLWVLQRGGAFDVETPYGIASARAAYLSLNFDPQRRDLTVSCLQGVCGFGSTVIPGGYKLLDARTNSQPEPMVMADYGAWGVRVPEATELAYLWEESIAQGSATMPVVATSTPSPTDPPTATARPSTTPRPSATRQPSPTTAPTDTDTPVPDEPTATTAPPTETATSVPPTETASAPPPTPTERIILPTVTRPPFTPLPPAPTIGRHGVLPGETIFCIARGYGVLPAAIAQANGIPSPFNIRSGTVLNIPQVRWNNISAGPVCAPQFVSPYPGLPFVPPTPPATSTPSAPPLGLTLNFNCISNCGDRNGDYVVRIEASAVGGIGPYVYTPAQTFDVTVPHCTTGVGSVSVTSADGQTASASWKYEDVSCPAP